MFNYTIYAEEKVAYVQIAPVDAIPSGERLFVEIDGQSIVIFNLAGEYFAIGDLCTHDDGPLGDGELEGYEAICPRHGARFDLRSGAVLSLPATRDIPAYPVRVREGVVEIGIPNK
ncbi:MAG: non-heme iron oxygenase ferredoxin subunit [Anaerolineales bacterium]|nr:non-heme iron oxygenase ferredoxin subunit [Anaerolineales bacterium]